MNHPFNFGAASLRGGSHHLPHPSNGLQHSQSQQQQRVRLRSVAVSAAAAAAGAAGMALHRQGKLSVPLFRQQQPGKAAAAPFLIPRELAEIMCGAFGEIVQVAVLYPLDTIKVRCQAGGLPVAGVVAQLMAGGTPGSAMRQLYAGVVSASLASVAIGSLYYFTFCAAKRAATRMIADAEIKNRSTSTSQSAAAGLAAPALNDGSSSSNGSSHQHALSHHYPHGAGVDYVHDPVFAAICSDEAAARVSATHGASSNSSTAATTSSSSSSAAAEPSSQGRLQANIMAACAAAVVGAVIEAPLELFKHRAQAGQIQGNMLGHIFSALKKQGPVALYGSFFLPFCFKSLPFDIGELMTYSSLQDWKETALAKAKAAPAAAAPGTPGVVAAAGAAAAAAGAAGVQLSTAGAAAGMAAASWDNMTAQQQQQQRGVLALSSITAASSDLAAVTLLPYSSSAEAKQQQFVSSIPEHFWDMGMGAAAGAAAVMISMPPDCVKTVMETGGGVAAKAGSGPLGSAAAFYATGQQLVKQRGVTGGLFMGLAPRLVESVPSTMLYWLAVEGCRRVLEPYTAK